MSPAQTALPIDEQKKPGVLDFSALGPRQNAPVREIASAFQGELKTYVELTGVVGGREDRWAYSQPFGGVARQDVRDAWQKLTDEYSPITMANRDAFVEASKVVLGELAKNRPVTDKRISMEEHQEREARLQAEREKQEAARQAAAASWAPITEKAPAWAQALIIAEERIDDSDMMTDYYASHVGRRVAIGFRSGSREDFKQLRKAAAAFEPTKDLDCDEAEKRENYSMGAGNYLGRCRNSGWHVCSLDRKYWGGQYGVVENHLPAAPVPAAAAKVDGVQLTVNEEKNGLEIRFPEKPAATVIETLKAHGWRWSRFSSCWYTRRSDQAQAFARTLLGLQEAQ